MSPSSLPLAPASFLFAATLGIAAAAAPPKAATPEAASSVKTTPSSPKNESPPAATTAKESAATTAKPETATKESAATTAKPETTAKEGAKATAATPGTAETTASGPTPTSPARSLPPGLAEALLLEKPSCEYGGFVGEEPEYVIACGNEGLWKAKRGDAGFSFEKELLPRPVTGFRQVGAVVIVVTGPSRDTIGGFEPDPDADEVDEVEDELDVTNSLDLPVAPAGEVIRVEPGLVDVVVAPGSVVRPRSHISFGKRGDTRIVGEVTYFEGEVAHVQIGMNEEVKVGALAWTTTEAETRSVAAPKLSHAKWAFGATVRPWIGGSGSGVLSDAFAEARFGWFRGGVLVDPVNIPIGSTPVVAEAMLRVAAATQFLEAGVSSGVATITDLSYENSGSGWLIAPHLRVGTEDGLNIRARVGTAIFHQKPTFSSVVVDLKVPVSFDVALIGKFAGGQTGYILVEGGMRVLVLGDGGKDSLFLQGTGGLVQTKRSSPYVYETSQGPMIGFGFEYRL